jgi:hypothetical protein
MDFLRRIPIAVAVVAVVATVTPSRAQISPGELSQPHSFLEGMKNCLKCHELGEGPSDDKCLDCHEEIAAGIDQNRGYHYRDMDVEKTPCFECHSEHAGRNFQLVHWPDGVNNFDHQQTGYPLVGRHGRLKCRDCHKPELIREDLGRFGGHVKPSRTYLGLHTECLSCHVDEHRGQLADECTQCHDQHGWKPAPGFDHRDTRYRLTGKHNDLACAKCHLATVEKNQAIPDGKPFVRYTGLSYSACTPCHSDVHRGEFGPACSKCHNTSGWLDIAVGEFNHEKTRFALSGLHAGLECEKCHRVGTRKAPLAHDRCTDCHADIHRGQFAQRDDGGRCESCHDVFGFFPPQFTLADHQRTRFSLEGAHRAQPCTACHARAEDANGGSYVLFAIEDTGCVGCHTDVHFGQFSAGHPAKDCTICHNLTYWSDVTFVHDRDSSYRLEGEHRKVDCGGCHVPVTVNDATFIRYKPIDPSCKSCHTREGLELKTSAAGGS